MNNKFNFVILMHLMVFLISAFCYTEKPSEKEKTYQWKMVSVYEANTPIFHHSIDKFVKNVALISKGQLQIELYSANEIINGINKAIEPRDVFNTVSEGAIQMGFGAPIYWTENVPGCEFMYAVPFGLSAIGMHSWLKRGDELGLWKELFENQNIISFPIGATGGAMGGWFRKEINTVDDFKGLKIRMSGFCSKILSNLGAERNWMVANKVSTAYNKGELDAIVCQGPYNDQIYKFHRLEPTPYYFYPGWQEPGGTLALIVNKKAWEDLPPHLQETIEIVRISIDQYIYTQFISADSLALQSLRSESKVKIRRFPSPVLKKLKEVSEKVLEEEAAKNPQFKKVYEAFKKFKASYNEPEWIKMLDEAVHPQLN